MTAVLDKLGVGRVIAIGHSMGGEVATALVEADPSRIKRLVLIDSPPKPETTFKRGTRLALMPLPIRRFARRITTAWHMRPKSPGSSVLRR